MPSSITIGPPDGDDLVGWRVRAAGEGKTPPEAMEPNKGLQKAGVHPPKNVEVEKKEGDKWVLKAEGKLDLGGNLLTDVILPLQWGLEHSLAPYGVARIRVSPVWE